MAQGLISDSQQPKRGDQTPDYSADEFEEDEDVATGKSSDPTESISNKFRVSMGGEDAAGLEASHPRIKIGSGEHHDSDGLQGTSKFGGDADVRDSFDEAFDKVDDAAPEIAGDDYVVKPRPKRP